MTARSAHPQVHRLAAALGALVAAAALMLGPIPAASAHATLLFATPAIDGAVPATPPAILIVFDQPVSAARSAITLTSAAGESIPLGPTSLTARRTTLRTATTSDLAPGAYAVHWLVTAEDGDAMQGSYHFAVGSAAGLEGSSLQGTRGATTTALLRWLLFAGLALTLGGLVGARLDRHTRESPGERSAPEVSPPLLAGTVTMTVAAVVLAVTTLGDGAPLEGLSHLSLESLASSAPARLAAIEALASLLALLFLRFRRTAAAVPAGVVVVMAEGLRAHPHAQWPIWGALSVGVHLLAAAIWIGALTHVIRAARVRRHHGIAAGPLVGAYAGLALWLLVVVVLTGVLNGLAVIPVHQLPAPLTAPGYGRWLIVKLALVALATGLAAAARLRLRNRTDARQPSPAARLEAVALVGVLGVSGALTVSAPPVDPNAPLPFPPPAAGPVYSVGARAGWVGIGASASEGQLLVRLTAPELANQTATSDDYALQGNLTIAGRPSELTFRRCGIGCFVAPVTWGDGADTVTLHVDHAGDLAGGTAALPIAWPPHSAEAILRRVVSTMRSVPHLDVHERVTSDANQQPLTPTVLHLSGSEFLNSDPYGSARATTTNLGRQAPGETTIALGFPGDDTYIELTVDPSYRILRETLTGPNHLVQRTFVYPEPHGRHAD